ncbi:MAG: GTP cyclohydrolase I FolE [Waterburya sp.]
MSFVRVATNQLFTQTIVGVEALLSAIGEDANRDGLYDTPIRFAKALLEMTSGYEENPLKHLAVQFDNEVAYDQMIISKDIPFTSLCEHHILPFTGVAHIAYIPSNGKIVGLSKLARVVEGYARRLQVQERLTKQIHDAIESCLEPIGAAVIIEAHHTCQSLRGIKKPGNMTTSAMSGVFRDNQNNARSEFLELIRKP